MGVEGGRRVRAMVPVPGEVVEVGKGEGGRHCCCWGGMGWRSAGD